MRIKNYKVLIALMLSMTLTNSVLAQSVMNSGTYKMESDSINVAGVRSASPTYSLEDTAGEVATGRSHSTSFKLFEAGYQGMRLNIGTTTPPTQPTGLTATGQSRERIELDWTASTGSLGVARYRIYRDGTLVGDTSAFPTTYVDSGGLTAETNYLYNVSALDDDGNESLWSATTTGRTLAAGSVTTSSSRRTPQIVSLSVIPANNSSIVLFSTSLPAKAILSWGLDSSYLDGNTGEDFNLTQHQFLITDLKSDTPYLLRILVTGDNGQQTIMEQIPFRTMSLPITVAPPNISNFKVTQKEKTLDLTWKNPIDAIGVRIVRSTSFYGSSPDEGEIVFEGNAQEFVDREVEEGVTYYYTIFAKDQSGNFSSGVVGAGKIVPATQVPTEIPPIENVPLATNVDPAIAALQLKDFLFIQHGDSLPVIDDTIHLNASEDITVALKYYKVPPVLKTIAVTLTTLGNNPETFSFILRVNRDKTRYEATISPLVTQNYKVSITVLDYKNQGMKKINGALKVGQSFFGVSTTTARNVGFPIVGILIIILVIRRSKRRKVQEIQPVPVTT
ncbi:hypothetical protein KW790_02340 [Candidatus Parcubacteria bacterium]|nr:hypothetical protein [Candidatus Parcubacteria bacterium]